MFYSAEGYSNSLQELSLHHAKRAVKNAYDLHFITP
jgi:hypothetical protein